MIAKVYAKTKVTDKEGEFYREPRINEFNYRDIEAGSFRNLVDNLINSVNAFIKQKDDFNQARILDTEITVRGYRIVFTRDDGTVVDEVDISDETIDEVADLVVAFTTI